MGKGDKKTAKGKRTMGSYGVTRKRKEEKVVIVPKVKKVKKVKKVASETTKPAAKKPAAKKTATKKSE
jgi:30S ribosomal protein S31